MTGHSILYIGRGDEHANYLAALETLPCCTLLSRSTNLQVVHESQSGIEVVLLDVGPDKIAPGEPIAQLIQTLDSYPIVALTSKRFEHHGILALKAGAQGYLCVDATTPEEQKTVFDHAVNRFELQQTLSRSDAGVLSILESINDGVIVVDLEGHVMDINPAARTVLGLSARELPDLGWGQAFCCLDEHGNAYANSAELPLNRARRGEKFSGQVSIYRADGQPDCLLSINGQGLFDGDQRLAGGVITFRDITDSRRRRLALQKRAQYDELTSLPNRGLFVEHLSRAIGRSQRKKSPLAVLFIDLDRFKSINDTLGHDTGDLLLCDVAERLRSNLRIGDFCGRWGGDEFVVCLEDFGDAANAAAAAQKLLLVLSDKYFIGASEAFVTPSIGIATYPEAGDDAERLIKAADIAMFESKKRGGGRFQYYSPALNARLEQREELEVGLRHALVRRELLLHYQPRIDLTSGRLIGFEALLRWQHPRYGLLAPERFLPLLEGSGLIHSAGDWTIETAARQLAAWQRQFELPDLTIAINVSTQQLKHDRLIETVGKALQDTALDPGCIELEISNSNIIRNRVEERDTMAALRKLGVRLSLDRFGVSEMSLESLESSFIDSFVLDQSLISDVEENNSHQRIVRAAIAMAQGLDIEVAAGGVETLSQLDFLRSCNCDLAQGFLISQPMQAEKVAQVLRSEVAGQRLVRAM
ncbi:MAG: EAL domain-containing protein [Woeseiaceae bacterium]|nr:EAL domain-containing protein [Woeseiaceae bacterium]